MLSGLSGYIKSVKNAIHGHATQAKPTLGKIRVGNREVDEIKLISQGGYAYVFQVRDTSTGEIFALKKMICQSPERFETAKNEIKMLRALPNHPNLLRVFDSSIENRDNCYYVYVLLEYCDGGSIFDQMAKYESTKLSEKQIIFIMREVCEGVKVLHSCKPPIAHRDLKIENVLLRDKRFKLCDFGSCSTDYVDFSKVPQSKYATYEEEYEKNTTLMYRPPEMCDPYQRQIVSEKVDVWMVGCILYTMCFYKHPFQEMTKLSIVNAAYTFPEDHPYPEKMVDLIRIMLTPHPNHRPTIYEIADLFQNYFNLDRVKLNPDAQRIREEQRKNAQEMRKFENNNSRLPKFDGDIPIEELMKLQKALKSDEDASPAHQQRGNRQQQQPQQFRQNNSASKSQNHHHHHSDSFDSFGQGPKKQQNNVHQFNSSPGIQESNNWYDFKQTNNQTPKQNNNNWHNFDNNNSQPKPSSFAPQFNSVNQGNQGNQRNQEWSNNQNPQSAQTDNKVNGQWNNFGFNSTPAQQQNNNNNNFNNSGNSWATNNWGAQNQNQNQSQNQQGQSFNGFNAQNNNNQNNGWNNFGGNSNMNNMNNNMNNRNNMNNTNNMNNFQQNNNMMNQQPQKSAPVITDNLLDLAEAPVNSNGTPNIMALYSMHK